jgi:hypothetical protein
LNRPLLGRISSFLFAFAAIGFGLVFAYSAVRFPVDRLLPAFQWEYALKNGFLLFVESLIPLCAAAVAIAASLAGSSAMARAAGAPAQPFSRVAGSTIVTFVLLAVAYAVLFEGVAPNVRRRISDMEYRSRVGREFLRQAEKARNDGDWAARRDALALYLAIDKTNRIVTEQKLEAEAEAAARAKPAPKPAPPREPPGDVDASSLVEKARYYYEREDWFSAHYYASRAATIAPTRTDAPQLAAQAWGRITGAAPSRKDRQATELYRKKLAAYAMLGKDPMAAYYSFLDLEASLPKDPDIKEYLAESSRLMMSTSFFSDELEGMAALPGTERILFVNGSEKDFTETVFIGKMVEAGRRGTYFMDLEAIRYRPTGEVLWHFKAPYGRLEEIADGRREILLLSVDRNDRTKQAGPLYIAGARPAGERNLLIIAPTTEERAALAIDGGGAAAMGLPRLWRLRERLGAFGMQREALETDIVMMAFMPFAFLALSFFSLSFGWAFRARYLGRPPLLAILFIPLVPVAAALASLLYVHAHRIVLGFAVLAFGLTAALIVGAALSLVLLAIALALTAGQAT